MLIGFLYFRLTTGQPSNFSHKIRTFELSITAYLFLVLYRSTSLQSLSFLKNIKTFLCKQKLVNNRSIPSKQQPYNHDSVSKILRASTAIQSRLFLKNIENFLCKQKLVNNCSIPSTHAEKRLPIFLINTLLLHIPLLALRTDEMTDGETNTLAALGLEELVSSCVVLSVFGSSGKQVLVLHTYILRVQYSCGIVLVFWFWQEIVFCVTYVLSVQYSCVVVSVIGCGEKQFSK